MTRRSMLFGFPTERAGGLVTICIQSLQRPGNRLIRGLPYPTLVTSLYGGTSEIMKTIIAREVTGLRT